MTPIRQLPFPELIRLLVDIEGVDWDKAWKICINTFGFTNHTLMPEALETWPVEILGRILPRHLEIIYNINHQFLAEVKAHFPNDAAMQKNFPSSKRDRSRKYVWHIWP